MKAAIVIIHTLLRIAESIDNQSDSRKNCNKPDDNRAPGFSQ